MYIFQNSKVKICLFIFPSERAGLDGPALKLEDLHAENSFGLRVSTHCRASPGNSALALQPTRHQGCS